MEKVSKAMAESVESIDHVVNRLKFLFEAAEISISGGGYEAFCDASHRILKDDIERLEEVSKELKFLSDSGTAEPPQARRWSMVDNSLALPLIIAKMKIIEDRLGLEAGEEKPSENVIWGLNSFLQECVNDLEKCHKGEEV